MTDQRPDRRKRNTLIVNTLLMLNVCVCIPISTPPFRAFRNFFRARKSPPPQVRRCPYAYGYNIGAKRFLRFETSYRKEVLAYRVSYRKDVPAAVTSNRKEVLAAWRIQAQATRKRPARSRKKLSACGRKKKFLRVHYFLAVLYYSYYTYYTYCSYIVLQLLQLLHVLQLLQVLLLLHVTGAISTTATLATRRT